MRAALSLEKSPKFTGVFFRNYAVVNVHVEDQKSWQIGKFRAGDFDAAYNPTALRRTRGLANE
jgi:hypothetical protein